MNSRDELSKYRISYAVRIIAGAYLCYTCFTIFKNLPTTDPGNVTLNTVMAVVFAIVGALFIFSGVKGFITSNKKVKEIDEKEAKEEQKREEQAEADRIRAEEIRKQAYINSHKDQIDQIKSKSDDSEEVKEETKES